MNARELAVLALRDAQKSRRYAQDELQRLMGEYPATPADRALATEITLGTVRHRRSVDLLLDAVLDKPLDNLEATVRLVLESAVYQMLFLDRVPDYAVVNEAVELARKYASHRWPGLVNAVLHKVQKQIDREAKAEDVTDMRRLIPSPHGGYIVLKQPLLVSEPQKRLADAWSFPDFLVERWCRRWGEVKTTKILEALNRPPRVFARVNTLRTSAAGIVAGLAEEQRQGARIMRANVIDLTDAPHDILLDLLARGLVTVEDPTAMAAVEGLDPKPGETVLDLCAAPGGKTSYIAERMKDRGTIFALDRTEERLQLLRQTVERLGLKSVRVGSTDSLPKDMPRAFDRVLVDVPCSNTGVLQRRAEARWRMDGQNLKSYAEVQMPLLAQAAALTRPGGTCVYSTCSLEPEENGRLVHRFLADNRWMVLQMERETLPSTEGDGGYFARMNRME